MKKVLLKVAFLTVILCSELSGTLFFRLGKANPHMVIPYYAGDVAPEWSTESPTVLILSSENTTVYGGNDVSLSLNVSVGDSKTASWCFLEKIYYEIDGQSNKTSVYENIRKSHITGYHDVQKPPIIGFSPSPKKTTSFFPSSKMLTEFSETINLTGIPDGNHSITVYAVESGYYYLYSEVSRIDNRNTYAYYNSFRITGSSLFRFSVDTAPPEVSVFSPENVTCYSPETLLNFTVNEKSSRMVYSLDGQKNVTISGNTTLSNLPVGEHNVTVYATDNAGNTGTSDTVHFSVEEPFPITMVIAPVASVAVVGVGLLVYFKKRKQ